MLQLKSAERTGDWRNIYFNLFTDRQIVQWYERP